jgi:hypothetical protein
VARERSERRFDPGKKASINKNTLEKILYPP